MKFNKVRGIMDWTAKIWSNLFSSDSLYWKSKSKGSLAYYVDQILEDRLRPKRQQVWEAKMEREWACVVVSFKIERKSAGQKLNFCDCPLHGLIIMASFCMSPSWQCFLLTQDTMDEDFWAGFASYNFSVLFANFIEFAIGEVSKRGRKTPFF